MQNIHWFVGAFSDWLAVVTTVVAVLAWRKTRLIRQQQEADERRRSEPIRLILVRKTDKREHVLEYQPRRDQASRGELLGILGMYSGSGRFESSHLVPLLESGEFSRMIDGSQNELRFPVSAEDFERFSKQDALLSPPATNPPLKS